MTEGRDPLSSYNEILRNAVPKIRERIKIKSGLDMKNVTPIRVPPVLDVPIGGTDPNGNL